MESYSYSINYGDWVNTITINYTTSYNSSTNQTTITFGEGSWSYYGKYDWSTKASNTITVSASDNESSTGTTTMSASGYTLGSIETYTATPDPASITVTHASGTGTKSININIATKIFVNPEGDGTSQVWIGGSSSTTAISLATYTLSISAGTGSSISVKRSGTSLSNGATLMPGDSLTITFGASTGYALNTHTVNGSTFTSGNTYTVSSNVNVVSTALVQSFLLSVSEGAKTTIVVNRISSPLQGGAAGALSDGATIYYNDVLEINFVADSGYTISSATVNDVESENIGSYTVTGNVVVYGESVSSATYKLYVYTYGGAAITVSRTNSSTGEISEIASGATLNTDDSLEYVIEIPENCWMSNLVINGNPKKVNSDVSIAVYANENPTGVNGIVGVPSIDKLVIPIINY